MDSEVLLTLQDSATRIASPPSAETYPASIVAALASGAALRGPHRHWGDWGTHGGHSETAGTLRLRRKLTDTLSGQTS